jgi:hypothetical protein
MIATASIVASTRLSRSALIAICSGGPLFRETDSERGPNNPAPFVNETAAVIVRLRHADSPLGLNRAVAGRQYAISTREGRRRCSVHRNNLPMTSEEYDPVRNQIHSCFEISGLRFRFSELKV